MVFLLLGIHQQTTIRVHERFSSIIHISEYVVSSVHTIFFFLLHSILLDLWKINQLLLCFRGFVRNIFATFNRNKNSIWFLSQSFQMKRFSCPRIGRQRRPLRRLVERLGRGLLLAGGRGQNPGLSWPLICLPHSLWSSAWVLQNVLLKYGEIGKGNRLWCIV